MLLSEPGDRLQELLLYRNFLRKIMRKYILELIYTKSVDNEDIMLIVNLS